MNERVVTAWQALDGEWHYLGRRVRDGYDIATLVPGSRAGTPVQGQDPGAGSSPPDVPREPLAPAFTSEVAAHEFVAAAPVGIELLTVIADDYRAKEEWLRALIEQGTRTLVFDPRPSALHSAAGSGAAIATHTALGYVLSHRRASACL